MSQVSTTSIELGGQFAAQFAISGVKPKYDEAFPLSDINIVAEVQCRTQDIAPTERVARYQEQMAAGAVFPPLVVREHDGALIDGSTRLAAAVALGRRAMPVYLVTPRNNEEALILGGALNQLGGKDLDAQDARIIALVMLARGKSPADISERIGVAQSKVTRWKAVEAGREKAAVLGIEKSYKEASQNQQEQLAKVTNDAAFRELTSVLEDHQPVQSELKQLVKKVATIGNDADAIEAVAQVSSAWPKGQGRGVAKSPAMAAAQPIGALLKHDAEYWVDVVRADVLFERWSRLAELSTAVVESYLAQGAK